MTNTPKPGAVIYAKALQRVARFYEDLLSIPVTHVDRDHVVLETPVFQLIVHAIPEPIASAINISAPPQVREETPIKLLLPVASIAEARARVASSGGRVNPSEREWEANGIRACDGYDPEGNVFQVRQLFFVPRQVGKTAD